MCMAANKVDGIRAAVVSDTFSARATRLHNDANVLCLGERVVGAGLAREILAAWLSAEYEGGRHQRRIDKITALER
jgi:ribose 5-phosphate isomerase B